MPWPRWANRLTRRCPNVIMQDQNAGAAVRTWSQHAAADGPRGEAEVERKGRGRMVCQAGPPACMQQQLVASRTLVFVIHAGRPVRTSSPLPPFPAAATRRGEGRGADSTVKRWVSIRTNGTELLDGDGMSGPNVDEAEAENCTT